MPHLIASSRVRALAVGAVALACLTVLPACNIIGAATYLVAGPPKVDKLYDLDPTKRVVVFIDDRIPVVNSRTNRVKIGAVAEDLLLNEAKIERVLSSQDMLAVAEREKGSKLLSIVELGEKLNAEVIICAQIMSFTLSPDGQAFAPSAGVKVKVMDVKEKKRLWPKDDQEWFPLSVQAPQRQGDPPRSLTAIEAEYSSLAERVGRQIAYIFYTHEARTHDGRIDQ